MYTDLSVELVVTVAVLAPPARVVAVDETERLDVILYYSAAALHVKLCESGNGAEIHLHVSTYTYMYNVHVHVHV